MKKPVGVFSFVLVVLCRMNAVISEDMDPPGDPAIGSCIPKRENPYDTSFGLRLSWTPNWEALTQDLGGLGNNEEELVL